MFEQDSVFSHGCLSFHFILRFGVNEFKEDVFAWPLTFVLHLILLIMFIMEIVFTI